MSATNWPEDMQPKAAAQGGSMDPLWVGMAILLFFPLGLFLLWRHPTLSRSKTWWWVGGIWSVLVYVAAINKDEDKEPPAATPTIAHAAGDPAGGDPGHEATTPVSTPDISQGNESPGVHPLYFDENGRRAVYRELREGMARIEAEADERFGASTKEDNLRGVLLGDERLTNKSKWQTQRLMELFRDITDRRKLPEVALMEIDKEGEAKGW